MKWRMGAARHQRSNHAMRGFGFIGALGFLVLLFIAGAIGFGLGQGVPAAVPVAGTPVVYYGHPGFFGFGIFGFLLFLFLIFAVIGIFRRAAWGHRGWGHGHGYYGRGVDMGSWDKSNFDKSSWGNRPVPPFADEMLGRWHRDAHGEPTPTDPTEKKTDNQPNSQG
ncbi:MAG: hypothetical protein QFC55_09150 [Chloroflexota bacterium]|nr:hypothetical protein [Chloroflexota bacterium]